MTSLKPCSAGLPAPGGGATLRRIVFLLALLGLAATTLAQELLLSGTVRERRTQAPVAGADVWIVQLATGIVSTAQTGPDGSWSYTAPTSVDLPPAVPEQFSLQQNYPNPFNPSTIIPFTVRTSGRLHLAVHTILGQELDSRDLDVVPGRYTIRWQGKGAAGVLFYSLSMGGTRLTRRMIQLDGGGREGFGGVSAIPLAAASVSRTGSPGTMYRITGSSVTCEPESVDIDVASTTRADLLLSTVHDRAFVIDLHNDVLEKIMGSGYELGPRHTYNHTDIPRMRDGGLDAQCISVYIDPRDTSNFYSRALTYLHAFKQQVAANPADLGIAATAEEVAAQNDSGRIACPLLLEGGYAIENDLAKLRDFYTRGIRIMTITWNTSTAWAVAAADSRSSTAGLSSFGQDVIRLMDSLGMIIDVSHTGIKTIDDILATTKNPIIASHSGVRALRDHYRNLTDTQIKAIAARGGVIGVVFYPPFLSSSGTSTIATVIQHIDYIRNLVGIDYIALGSDFDGIERVTSGLEDVSHFPALTEALLRHGYSREEVRKILGENFMRVFRMVCGGRAGN